MPLMKGKSQKAFGHNVAAEMHAGKPQNQAVAIAYSEKRKHMFDGGYAEGGEVDDDQMMIDQCAMECMEAIEKKDKDAFIESLHVLIAHMIMDMQTDEQGE